MRAYYDSSVALRHILSQPDRLGEFMQSEELLTSALARVEIRRTLDRVRLIHRLSDSDFLLLLDNFDRVESRTRHIDLSSALLERAGDSISVPVGTLDAVHLVSAVAWARENPGPFVFMTHDRQLSVAGRAMGLSILGA